jgi:hypothetical protein
MKSAAEYVELIQRRPDIHFNDEVKEEFVRLLRSEKRMIDRKRESED